VLSVFAACSSSVSLRRFMVTVLPEAYGQRIRCGCRCFPGGRRWLPSSRLLPCRKVAIDQVVNE
jgi:hypothetical protein